ncbi:MAG: hypothetical protein FWE95_02900 [Planctomycetaceae bacterium]|nr:hypothetical protein [Planctomycetaceae bacterium]
MNQGMMMNTVIAAVVGGIIGAGVVFFAGGSKVDPKNLVFDDLKVANLTITEGAVLLNEKGEPELFIRDGSILAEKVILGNKIVGQQLQGHAIVGNRIFATPDNLVTTPMERWRFYAEIGASLDAGGEFVVRSVNGPSLVGQATTTGALLRYGFTPEGAPQMLAIQNANRSLMQITNDFSAQQRQLIEQGNPNSFNGPANTAGAGGAPPLQ